MAPAASVTPTASAAAPAPSVEELRRAAIPLDGSADDYDRLVERVGDARWVLIGEASHGTHEFYRERGQITRRLIEEKGFSAVVVEADWPDAYRVNRYVRGTGPDRTAEAALRGLGGFPAWMWRNTDVEAFVEWLRDRNEDAGGRKVGFYGMDLYSLYQSMDAVVAYLERVDPKAAQRARERYACFEDFGDDPAAYGARAARDAAGSCRDEVAAQLRELERTASQYSDREGPLAEDEAFAAAQNARLAHNAEEYYRALYEGRRSTWNLRDTHMADTLDALAEHLATDGERPKLVVWAHNSHLGDARATGMAKAGELNVGQLIRQRHGDDVVSVGFTTYTGTVRAAHDWGEEGRVRDVREALPDSFEAVFHEVALDGPSAFYLDLRTGGPAASALGGERLERAIGVIYRPETERWSHYFEARLPDQFDIVIHIDRTSAVEPLPPVPVGTEQLPPTDTEPVPRSGQRPAAA